MELSTAPGGGSRRGCGGDLGQTVPRASFPVWKKGEISAEVLGKELRKKDLFGPVGKVQAQSPGMEGMIVCPQFAVVGGGEFAGYSF